jgi:hypothetical protein
VQATSQANKRKRKASEMGSQLKSQPKTQKEQKQKQKQKQKSIQQNQPQAKPRPQQEKKLPTHQPGMPPPAMLAEFKAWVWTALRLSEGKLELSDVGISIPDSLKPYKQVQQDVQSNTKCHIASPGTGCALVLWELSTLLMHTPELYQISWTQKCDAVGRPSILEQCFWRSYP